MKQDEIVDAASQAFWAKVAELCPTAKTGDFPPLNEHMWDNACNDAVRVWMDLNVPKAGVEAKFRHFELHIDDMVITNPTRSSCGRFSVSPEAYGFTIIGTGGGCTAWCLDIEICGVKHYVYLTNGDLGHDGKLVDMGVYTEDGDMIWYCEDIDDLPL